jgi:rhamnose transport system substrate-binding protein
MGKITMEKDGEAAMAPPFTYNASNIDQFAKIF